MGRDEDLASRHHAKDEHPSRKRDSPSDSAHDSRQAHKRRRRSHSPVDRDSRDTHKVTATTDRHSSHRHRYHGSSSTHRRKHDGKSKDSKSVVDLPFSARPLSKADLPTFRPLFAYFLDLQKQIEIDDLDDREIRGRWKSFVGKWNRGELAEGWYDPDMFARIAESASPPMPSPSRDSPDLADHTGAASQRDQTRGGEDGDDDDDDDYGPVLPGSAARGRQAGPGIPSLQDLSVRNEMLEEDREGSRNALRDARKSDRALQKEQLNDILPRAEAGTRERQLEKRQMVNEKMREFRDKSPGLEGGNDRDLMGGGGDELEDFKKEKERQQRKKSEREIRREEMDRARREEIEEKRRAWAEREEGTVSMLRELAKQRFG